MKTVVIGRPASRRIPDASHRKECITIAEIMAQIMVRDLKGPINGNKDIIVYLFD